MGSMWWLLIIGLGMGLCRLGCLPLVPAEWSIRGFDRRAERVLPKRIRVTKVGPVRKGGYPALRGRVGATAIRKSGRRDEIYRDYIAFRIRHGPGAQPLSDEVEDHGHERHAERGELGTSTAAPEARRVSPPSGTAWQRSEARSAHPFPLTPNGVQTASVPAASPGSSMPSAQMAQKPRGGAEPDVAEAIGMGGAIFLP